jgi:putative ABC transport system permease protein
MQRFTLPAYLALKEIWRNRGRFLLFSLVIALITLLVLFIAGLGEGLANSNRQYLSKLDANLLLYQEKSDYIIAASRIALSKVEEVRNVPGVADAGSIATSLVAIELSDGGELKVSLLGVDPGHPGEPEVKDGQQLNLSGLDEVILDQNVISRSNLKLGDTITIRSSQGTDYKKYTLKVVGITSGQAYTFTPSIFVPISTWEKTRTKSEAEISRPTETTNVIAVKLNNNKQSSKMQEQLEKEIEGVQAATISMAIKNVPGYSAQQSTIQTQGIFTLLIGVLVIGGFFQIQVLQKVPQIGVLKAIGTPNPVVGLASVIQIVVVTSLGVAIGGLLTFLFSLTFPPNVPIVFNGQSSLIAIIALLLIGPIGGFVSIRYAVRIEPLKALRLS